MNGSEETIWVVGCGDGAQQYYILNGEHVPIFPKKAAEKVQPTPETHEQVLASGYPEQIIRIRELSERKFLIDTLLTRAPDALACAFLWHDTNEGWEFWNNLYERGPHV